MNRAAIRRWRAQGLSDADIARLRELADAQAARDRQSRCRRCGCTAGGARCAIRIDGDGSWGTCSPRGSPGLPAVCSACVAGMVRDGAFARREGTP